GYDTYAGELQQRERPEKSRVFYPDTVAGFQQRSADQLEGTGVTAGDEHLFRSAGDPAGDGNIRRDGFTQWAISHQIRVAHGGVIEAPYALRRDARPQFSGK